MSTADDGSLRELTVARFHAALRAGSLTTVALVDWYRARIAAYDVAGPGLGAIVTVNPRARDEAAALDARFTRSRTLEGPLHGVPVLVKDQAETAGLRTTFGSVLFADYVPDTDATLISRLRAAGAIVLAKTAMCDFAAGWFSSSSISGRTKNPYDVTRDAGGSSSGTAAGVAADFGLVGIGEDTGGSIRIPASFNNLFGLRVTTGLISRAGFSPLVHFQDTPGPIGRTVADVAALLDGIVGADPRDPLTMTVRGPQRPGTYARAVARGVPLDAWRVGVLESGFGADDDPAARPVNRVARAAIARMEQLGVTIVPGLEIDDLADWIARTSVYGGQSKADIDGFLARRPAAPVRSFMEAYASGRFHPANDLLHAIAAAPEAAAGDPDVAQRRAQQARFRHRILELFSGYEIDVLVMPTVRILPPTRAALDAGAYPTLRFPTNTVIAAQAGLPALTMPIGFTADPALPVGLELLARPGAEAELLQLGRGWERAVAPRRPPVL